MCGIVAVLNFNKEIIDQSLFVRMRDTMYHRGPDDAGCYLDDFVGLGHRRLAIIDLSESGHQPMANEDRTIWLVFNGEIYNYIELRENLKKRGHRFCSSSDTEVIIHQYEEDGEQCIENFNGMFSFVLWDNRKKKLFAARDRMGIKPLYYFQDHRRIILASEIKSIIEDPSVERMPDFQAVADYAFAGRALGSKTMFKNIKEVEPGHLLTVDASQKKVRVKKYWDIHYDYNYIRTYAVLTEELSSLVDDAVKVHCRSDAALGCHLSGGLDSSTIVALAARYRNPLKTFSIKFSEDEHIDETEFAKYVALHAGADYQESSPSAGDFARLLPFLMWHMDVPMATDGGFSYFTVSTLAKKHVKVSLTGHGGDELFAGYPAQFIAAYGTTDMFRLYTDPLRVPKTGFGRKIFERLASKGPSGVLQALKNRIIKKEKSLSDIWIQLHCGQAPGANPVFQKEFIDALDGYSPRDEYVAPLESVSTKELLDKCLYHDLRVYLPGLLHMEDRVSMATSIESRVPMLDYRIAELLATVPPEQKVRQMEPKHLLRRVGANVLPEKIWKRKDKRPFPVPGKFWFSGEMKKMVGAILFSQDSIERGVFRPSQLKRYHNNLDVAWFLVNVELWFKLFIDKDPVWLDQVSTVRNEMQMQ